MTLPMTRRNSSAVGDPVAVDGLVRFHREDLRYRRSDIVRNLEAASVFKIQQNALEFGIHRKCSRCYVRETMMKSSGLRSKFFNCRFQDNHVASVQFLLKLGFCVDDGEGHFPFPNLAWTKS